MMNAKMMQQLTKLATQSIKSITAENKAQTAMLGEVMKMLTQQGGGFGDATAKAMKDIQSTLLKTTKLIEAQTDLLGGLKPDDLAGDGADKEAEAKVKELEDAVKKITDENKKQATEIDGLLAEIDKAAKDAGDDKDAAKKIKTATAALEKAAKLIDEQTKLLAEAKKALAG